MNIVMIPVHLDALFLSHDQLVTEAKADFSRLPYNDGQEDINPDTVNISESVLSKPFQNQNLNLRSGIHLHWALPDGLTKGAAGGTADDYPAVPNRWLVARKENGTITKQWVVESDYLHSEGAENTYGSIAYPIDTPSGQPFRYMGRQLEHDPAAASWQEDVDAAYVDKLTAVGYGEPTFAAFYPNCHSVFGCFDEDVSGRSQLTNLSYQLIGWYSQLTKDPLLKLLTANSGKDKDTLEEKIKEKFGWELAIDVNNLPKGMCCYADLTFNAGTATSIDNTKKALPATVTIANTGTEALSAYIASQLNPTNKIQLEEQLESLLLQTSLQNRELDLGPRFKEARHEKGFTAESGGSLWEVKPDNDNHGTTPAPITLPPEMADTLDELNVKQQRLDQAREKLKHERHVLFSDWYKYMLCAYPPDDARDDYPDIDIVKWYIQDKDLPQLQEAVSDLNNKQTEVTAIKGALDQKIVEFNDSTIGKATLSKLLDTNTANTSGLTLNGTVDWPENKPFSDACLHFNGTDAYITIDGLTNVKAISLWVNLATQNTNDATLLATGNLGALISKDEIKDFWTKITINGEVQPSYKPLQWHNLPKDQWIHIHVEFATPLLDSDTIYLFGNAGTQFLRGKLASIRVFNEALIPDEIYVDRNILGHRHYALKEVAGPRFWQPTEPVVLLEAASVEPSVRHGEDGRLSADNTLNCQVTTVTNYPLQAADFTVLLGEIDSLRPTGGAEKIGYATWTMQSWHPFLLEWEVEVFPMQEDGNLNIDNRTFDPAFINTNFELPENSPELTVKAGKSVVEAAAIYSGRSILTPYAKKRLIRSIAGQLNNLKQEDCYQVISQITDQEKATYNQQLTTWYGDKPANDSAATDYETWYLDKRVYNNGIIKFSALSEPDQLKNFHYALIKTYKEITGNKHFISQSLGGFNAALLMHHQTLQLPIVDPIGFSNYQPFTELVKNVRAKRVQNSAPATQ